MPHQLQILLGRQVEAGGRALEGELDRLILRFVLFEVVFVPSAEAASGAGTPREKRSRFLI
jgi:hypothetical protein